MSLLKNWSINISEDGISVAVTPAGVNVKVSDDVRELVSPDVMIDNPGPNDVWVRAGNAQTAATLLSVRVPAGSMQPFEKGQTTHLALICAPGKTQTVVVHVGEGA